ncbi:MAG: prepilin-type N-terminal cleavage/methylation domain-containing protein [Planctomycetes bacterium]|nr:prepilin-type N-terminal cleavage/methylation domain-containing protein [Planctomycetota bacterium]
MRTASPPRHVCGFTLIEMLVVIAIFSMIVALTSLALTGAAGKSAFRRQANEFIRVMTMAQNAAAESDRRYAVILNFDEQRYTMRQQFIALEMSEVDLATVPYEEDVITNGQFTEQCQLLYVHFDDLEDISDSSTSAGVGFVAGHSGWEAGGKIVLLDRDGNPYSIIINRMSRIINMYAGEIMPGDAEFPELKYKYELPF